MTNNIQASRIQISDSNIKQKIAARKINFWAKSWKLIKRKGRKINVSDLLLGYLLLIKQGEFSYDNWATNIHTATGKSITGQGVWKWMSKILVEFVEFLLEKELKRKFDNMIEPKIFKDFKNVYLQDATHFSMPSVLFPLFPGSYSKNGNAATAKVQATFNLLKGSFSNFHISSYRDNDKKDAHRIIGTLFLKKGDLIIRDLGYFSLVSFQKMLDKGIYFLSRLQFNVIIYDENEKKIDLVKLLKKKKSIDMTILLGKKQKAKCRLVVQPIPDSIANERRRKAKNDRNKKTNHKKEYYFLLGYTLYITNVGVDIWNAKEITAAYRSRWYIEILFKAWKSHFKVKNNIPGRYIDQDRARLYFYGSLLLIVMVVMPFFIKIQKRVISKNKFVSILKLYSFVWQKFESLIHAERVDKIIEEAERRCLYESRKDRSNAMENLFLLCA